MKFKYLIIFFSIIVVLILLFIVILPRLLASPDLTSSIRQIILPLSIFIIIVFASVGIFLLINYRLLSLLEKEDWPALAYYLEQEVIIKGRISEKKVRLLASSYMVISDYLSVIKLENKISHSKPAIIEKNILIFGTAKILAGNYEDSTFFFKSHINNKHINKKDIPWVHWYYGFSHLLHSDFSQAETEFLTLAKSSDNALITGLSSKFLYNNIVKHSKNKDECKSTAEAGRSRVKTVLKNYGEWKKEANKFKDDIHVAIIRKYIEETGIWLFSQ